MTEYQIELIILIVGCIILLIHGIFDDFRKQRAWREYEANVAEYEDYMAHKDNSMRPILPPNPPLIL